ncbi:MAG: glycoside hydrolase family 31 protein [Clostridia bacterium]|nr:glycoside hydrolase family 31 protein [Clostridia bacterium]
MKHNTITKVLSLLLVMLMLLPMATACNTGGSNDDTTTTMSEEETTSAENDGDVIVEEKPEVLYIVNNRKSNYRLIYGKADSKVKTACMQAVNALNEKIGSTLEALASAEGESDCEILVGDQGDAELQALASSYALGEDDFAIKVVGQKIVILGGGDYALVDAVNFFFARMTTDIDDYAAYISGAFEYVCRADADTVVEITAKDENYVFFTVAPQSKNVTYCRLSFTGNSGWRIQTKHTECDEFNDIGASQRLSLSLGENPVLNLEKVTYTEDDKQLTVKAPDGSYAVIYLNDFAIDFYTAGGELANTVLDLLDDGTNSTIKTELTASEAIYGTGERYNTANQRGKSITMYTYDTYDKIHQNYMTIPLYCSSRGSGIFVNRYEYMVSDIGKSNSSVLSTKITDSVMDAYIFTTEQISDVIYGYSALSGFAEMPEEWTYGMLLCRLDSELGSKAGVLAMAQKMEQYDLPWTGVIMEGLGVYNSSKTNELKEVCEYLHAMGKKVLVYIRVGDPASGMSGFISDYYLTSTKPDGSEITKIPWVKSGTFNPDTEGSSGEWAYLDITNPDAVDWYFGYLWNHLSNEVGVDGAKIDFAEFLPETSALNYYDENTETLGSHHWYATNFCSRFWEMISSKPDGGMCFSRGGGIGSQRNPYMWAGDQARQYDRIQWQLTNMLSSGLSGVPFMSYDMAGYQYVNKQKIDIDKEAPIFIRSTQYSAFTICLQTHGRVRRSYDFADLGYPATTNIYRAYTKLHELLTPYITEYSEEACKTAMPLTRHLVLHWQNDENVYDIDDEYMFGDAFLVAPELKGKTQRDIYLPEGEWADLNTAYIYEIGNGTYKITKTDGTTQSGTYGDEGFWLRNYQVEITQLPVFYNRAEWNDSETAESLLDGIREIFAYASSIKYDLPLS